MLDHRLVAILPFVLLSLAGCTTSARTQYDFTQAHAHIYSKPIEQLWPAVRLFAFNRGWSIAEESNGSEHYFETQWTPMDPTSHQMARYLVQATPQSNGGYRISIQSAHRYADPNQSSPYGSGTYGSTADYGLEWELLQTIDPRAADGIQADAERKFKD